MKRFIEGQDRSQVTLLPECLDDYIAEDNPVRVVDAFVDELDLRDSGLRRRDSRRRQADRRTTRRSCSRSTSTATSTASSPAAGSSAKRSATSS